MDEKLMTLDNLAEYLNLSRRTVYRLLQEKDLPAYRIGSHLRFRRGDIDDWLQTKRLDDSKLG
ncbi:MAG TPA: helix-turn-helix domain-containing protein [bacterium]|nr:helix-turn-helix domain-containing protein [bacterium]